MARHNSSEEAAKAGKRDLQLMVEQYIDYLGKARTPSRAVEAAAEMLEENGFVKYDPYCKHWLGEERQIYFIDRNNVNIAAVVMGRRKIDGGINIAGAHVDFCTLTNKVVSLKEKVDEVYLDTRPYGGFYPHQWMDRPLLVIGETLVQSRTGKRVKAKWEVPGNIPEPTIHNPKGYSEKTYKDAFNMENLDIFTGYRKTEDFLKALNAKLPGNIPYITKEEFNSGFTQFHAVPAEGPARLGDYIVGYGHDDRSCMFAALKAIICADEPEYTCIALGVAREEIGSTSVGSANDVFLDNVLRALAEMQHRPLDRLGVYNRSVMLSADVDIAYNSQNKDVSDKDNCAQFGKGAAIVIANGSGGNPTGNIVMPNDLYYIERFLNKRDLAYQVTALPSMVGMGGGGGTIARYYSERGILTADMGIPVGNMHGTTSRIYGSDLDSAVEAFMALFQRDEERKIWG